MSLNPIGTDQTYLLPEIIRDQPVCHTYIPQEQQNREQLIMMHSENGNPS